MVGIAGGIPYPEKPEEHVRLGDIVVSDAYGTVQYDYGKKTISEWIPKPFPRPPSPDLLHAVTLLESAALKGELPLASVYRSSQRPIKCCSSFSRNRCTDLLYRSEQNHYSSQRQKKAYRSSKSIQRSSSYFEHPTKRPNFTG